MNLVFKYKAVEIGWKELLIMRIRTQKNKIIEKRENLEDVKKKKHK